MKSVSSAEANRQFSSVLRRAARGETILITSRGKPVAAMGPAAKQLSARDGARARLFERLRKTAASGKRTWTRDDLYGKD